MKSGEGRERNDLGRGARDWGISISFLCVLCNSVFDKVFSVIRNLHLLLKSNFILYFHLLLNSDF